MSAHDFAFLDGHFRVRHRRLKDRLVGSEEWMDFETELWGTPLMGGAAFIDEMRGTVFEREFWGITLRLFDPASGQWSLYWADTWHPGLCPPLVGCFESSVGIFLGKDEEGGRPVLARFRWTDTAGPAPRWEQAYSVDDGDTWEVNWIMEFERVGSQRPW